LCSLLTDLHKSHGWAKRDRDLHYAAGREDLGLRYSITALASLAEPHGYFICEPRVDSNDGQDFIDCLGDLCAAEHIVAGDILVVDGATVHTSAAVAHQLEYLENRYGFRMVQLPAYSPELNPAEALFRICKKFIRHHRGEGPLWEQMARGFATITHDGVRTEFDHCINRWFR
jgi:transposase